MAFSDPKPETAPLNDKNYATVKLLKPMLVSTTNFAVGDKVTVPIHRAREMFKVNAAVVVPFNPKLVPPAPAKRAYLAGAAPVLTEEQANNAGLAKAARSLQRA